MYNWVRAPVQRVDGMEPVSELELICKDMREGKRPRPVGIDPDIEYNPRLILVMWSLTQVMPVQLEVQGSLVAKPLLHAQLAIFP